MPQSLKELVDQLGIRKDKATKLEAGGAGIGCYFEVNPYDFLQRAEDDYEEGGASAYLNSITNAKRAIHCQIDQVWATFGFEFRRLSLPRKTELLVQLGFIAPRILRKVNQSRNFLEHEYAVPNQEQIEESLDLASLFIESTRKHLDFFMDEFSIGNNDEIVDEFHFKNELSFGFNEKNQTFLVRAYTSVQPEMIKSESPQLIGKICLDAKQRSFKDVIRLAVARTHGTRIERALDSFFSNLESI